MKRIICQQNSQLNTVLLRAYSGSLSFGALMKLYRKRDVKVNGKRVSKNCEVFVNDVIEAFFDEKPLELDLVYSDENIVVCNKPIGITAEDFFDRVKQVYPEAFFTHRLDTNTSGIIMFAKNQATFDELLKGFKQRSFEKYYYCLVYGAPKNDRGVLNDYLFKDAKKGSVFVSAQKTKGSLNIQTEYEVIKRGEISSLLKVRLITGRTHQIRAHLAFYGNFIIGDGKYGRESINKSFKQRTQLLVSAQTVLHFERDSFLHYLDKKVFSVDCSNLFEKIK